MVDDTHKKYYTDQDRNYTKFNKLRDENVSMKGPMLHTLLVLFTWVDIVCCSKLWSTIIAKKMLHIYTRKMTTTPRDQRALMATLAPQKFDLPCT